MLNMKNYSIITLLLLIVSYTLLVVDHVECTEELMKLLQPLHSALMAMFGAGPASIGQAKTIELEQPPETSSYEEISISAEKMDTGQVAEKI